MRYGKRYGPGGVRALGGGDASGMHGEGPTQKAVGTRGAHVEHLSHVHDLGRVEAERLVELLRGLPSRTRRGRAMRGEMRVEGGRVRGAAAAHASGMHARI